MDTLQHRDWAGPVTFFANCMGLKLRDASGSAVAVAEIDTSQPKKAITQIDPRPYYLVESMKESALKDTLSK